MRKFELALVIAMLVAMRQVPVRSQPSTAAKLWEQLQAVTWTVAYPTWQRQHPKATCDVFVAPPDEVIDGIGATELWSHRCRQDSMAMSSQWFFYAFNPRRPVERLEQVRVSVGSLAVGQLETAARELSALVSNIYGVPVSEGISEFGSSFWRQAARWRTSEVEVVLGVDEFPNRPPRLNVFVRHRPLRDVLLRRSRLENDALSGDAEPGALSNADLAMHSQSEFPEAAALLAASRDTAVDPMVLVRAAASLLEAAKTSVPERAGLLLWGAERLADRLAITERESAAGNRQREQLAAYGLTFEWDELAGSWAYAHDVLWRLWTGYPHSTWGGQAFVALLSRGWDTRAACRNGSDRFRDVIANGEAFLRANPHTPLRAYILLSLAQAYETWWSLSLASDRDDYANRREYQAGASSAGQKAITTYEEIIRRYAKGDEADFASFALPRLHLGIDTGQRRFFCVYD